MSDQQSARQPGPAVVPAAAPSRERRPVPASASDDTRLAVEIRELVANGAMDEARDRFAGLVATHQRRASRIAYQYLRDAAEADEAVQDAFVKAFGHIASYREAWPFEVWFTRILINGCLDRRKARQRRERWLVPSDDDGIGESAAEGVRDRTTPDPEQRLLSQERSTKLATAIDRLEGRQRAVFMLCHFGDYTP